MENKLLFKNYLKSLKQKYNAVCFDIDGTLTIKNSKNIDDRAIEMIIDLLNKKIPVVFITGRGETGLNDLKNDIYERIKNNEKITDKDLYRIYVLTNDGARLFYSDEVSKEKFLNENIYIATKDELNQLLNINKNICRLKENSKYGKYFNVTYSKDLKTGDIINVRLVFNTKNNKIINLIFDNINKFIINNKFDGVHLTRGIYKDKSVIQIGVTTKDKAIERVEKIIGVPRNSMIRIGDCGDFRGNDYAMLNCNQGYSVDKTNGSFDSCFPIFDELGNVLTGIDATLYLIKKAKILPTVCLEKVEKENYRHQFANIEKNIVLGRQKLLCKYNNFINQNFNDINGVDSLFDRFSGSIKIPMYEWEILEDNPLKQLWSSFKNNNLIYSMRDDNNYLLRGSSTYYYFISNRISTDGKDITTKKDVINWHNNYINFFKDSINAILSTNQINEQINKKLLLGILDNCRNVLLILLNHYLVSDYSDKNILLDISSIKENNFNKIYENLLCIEDLICKICFKTEYVIDKDYIAKNISDTMNLLNKNLEYEVNKIEKQDYSKDYRAYREIDNFGENYVAVSLYEENCDKNEFINSCGLSYGGIELPIISKIINKNKLEKILLLKFNKEVSGYSNKQLIDLRKFNINDFGGLMNSNNFENLSVDLFDDNVLTGKTLQLAINSLCDCNISVNNICIVRYPSINRIDQMFLKNPSAVDYHLFFDYIYGLCFSSPYSWKDNEWTDKNNKINYTDSLGIFDLNRKKIIECLIKNHDFNDESEVGEYKRRLTK